MSTASKVTLGTSIAFAIGSFVFINYSQQTERQSLREGPIKDAIRIEEKRKKLMRNSLEHQEQKQLKEQMEKVQPLTGEIITGPLEK
ncbi:protein Pet117p, mitochondrial [[Candida] jaroonii]|uniref:Protein Pet117p, mitochondrial n=1 Tax=[Candida] jaroonii TaxID=467808 RepID=A0ACA9YFV4_9ASCO|nr:protein Pet117p, mitochondrial [[Candida] jaroonii]